jgi:kynureninase
LIGASAEEVVVTDSVSVNLFKVLNAALSLQPGRPVIVTDPANFPTDTYIAQGIAGLLGSERAQLRFANADAVEAALAAGDVAVALLSHVDYRAARIEDMHAITALAHSHGALAVWDLSHSAARCQLICAELEQISLWVAVTNF